MGPRGLLMAGSLLAALGYLGAMFATSTATLLPVMMVIAAGLGLALPGYNAGATLAVEPIEHAAVAGQLSATVGLTYVAGPVMGAALYSAYDLAPDHRGGTAVAPRRRPGVTADPRGVSVAR